MQGKSENFGFLIMMIVGLGSPISVVEVSFRLVGKVYSLQFMRNIHYITTSTTNNNNKLLANVHSGDIKCTARPIAPILTQYEKLSNAMEPKAFQRMMMMMLMVRMTMIDMFMLLISSWC